MRKRVARILLLATSVFVLGAGSAMAQVDVELAFTPDTAAPGESVTLFASIANLSSDPVRANFTVEIALGHLSTGPLPFTLPLAAGKERSVELPFVLPPVRMGGTLTITVTATVGEATDTATASLTIVTSAKTTADAATLRDLGTRLGKALADEVPTATNDASMSDVKQLYR